MSSDLDIPSGLHVGLIMDGNGRWASARGQPRLAGHRKGGQVVKAIVEAAPDLGIGILTLYAFSADNWKRPPREVSGLMRLFRSYLASETARCVQNGVRLCVIGRRDRLSPTLLRAIEAAESETRHGRTLMLRVAIDYSAREAIVEAARVAHRVEHRDDFARALAAATHSPAVPDVDLLVRTGGEQRLSDFLLWECAYAELRFEECMWPDFDRFQLESAVRWFQSRDRRFGGLARAAAG
jgi:undecaprenyl diphosphate synthase